MTMPPDHDGAVPAQILVELGKMGAQLAVISEQLKTAAAAQVDHEQRIRSLERRQWPLPTIAVIFAAASAVAALLAYLRHP